MVKQEHQVDDERERVGEEEERGGGEYEEAEEEKDSSAVLENRNSRVDTPLQIVRVMTPPRFKSHASHGVSLLSLSFSLSLSFGEKKIAGRKTMPR